MLSRFRSIVLRAPLHSRVRFATGSVSNKPGSDSLKALNSNAVHEIKNLASDVIGSVAPEAQVEAPHNKNSIPGDLASIAALHQKIPTEALIYGGAGLIPYCATAVASTVLSSQASTAIAGGVTTFDLETSLALLHHVQVIQLQYGGLILAFLGSVHWGFQWSNFDGSKGHSRYLIGIAPLMLSFVSFSLAPQVGLMTQLFGFLGMWMVDSKLTTMGWVPSWYASYRFWLSGVVSASIILTLATSQFGTPGKITTPIKTTLKEISQPKQEAVSEIQLSEGDDAFTQFTNVEKVKAEALEKEKEEKARYNRGGK